MKDIFVVVGCEESQRVTIELRKLGVKAFSCDKKPCSGGHPEWHFRGDLISLLEAVRTHKKVYTADGTGHDIPKWHAGIFFPDCTYLTCSAEWAYKDGPYHQKVKPGTLVGEARREARAHAIEFFRILWSREEIPHIAIENPIGIINKFMKPAQIIHPWMFGDDASKGTCLWLKNLPLLPSEKIDYLPEPNGNWVLPRTVCKNCGTIEAGAVDLVEKALKDGCIECGHKVLPRWGNQTDSGQNKLFPSIDRAEQRSKTYPGIAHAMAHTWGLYLINRYNK